MPPPSPLDCEPPRVRILALETTERVATLAALDSDALLAESALDPRERSARTLAPGLQALLRQVGWRPSDVQLIALTVGPGSFTGLRVGVTTAKAFAYAVGAEVLGVNTLEVIASQAPADAAQLAVAMDAQRQQVFAGTFQRESDGALAWREPTHLADDLAWLESLSPGMAVSGPVLHKIQTHAPPHVRLIDSSLWTPKAQTVGQLAWRKYQLGQRDDLWRLMPLYFRDSAAEEKWKAREA